MRKKLVKVREVKGMNVETMDEGTLILNNRRLQFENLTVEYMIETDEISEFEFVFSLITGKDYPISSENKRMFMYEYRVNKKRPTKFTFETEEYKYDVTLEEDEQK